MNAWDFGNLTCVAPKKWLIPRQARVDIDESTTTIIARSAM